MCCVNVHELKKNVHRANQAKIIDEELNQAIMV